MDNKNRNSFMHDLNAEVERRIEIMEDPNYQFVPALAKTDKFFAAALILLSIVLIVIAV